MDHYGSERSHPALGKLEETLGWPSGMARAWITQESNWKPKTYHFNKAKWAVKGKVFIPGYMFELGYYQNADSDWFKHKGGAPSKQSLMNFITMATDVARSSEFTREFLLEKRLSFARLNRNRLSFDWSQAFEDRLVFSVGSGAALNVFKLLSLRPSRIPSTVEELGRVFLYDPEPDDITRLFRTDKVAHRTLSAFKMIGRIRQ